MDFWVDDDPEIANEESEGEMKLKVEFARSELCGRELLKCCITPIPRWGFPGALASKPKDSGEVPVSARDVKKLFHLRKRYSPATITRSDIYYSSRKMGFFSMSLLFFP